MEEIVGHDTFSKFDYQKFSNGSQTFRTTYLGPPATPRGHNSGAEGHFVVSTKPLNWVISGLADTIK